MISNWGRLCFLNIFDSAAVQIFFCCIWSFCCLFNGCEIIETVYLKISFLLKNILWEISKKNSNRKCRWIRTRRVAALIQARTWIQVLKSHLRIVLIRSSRENWRLVYLRRIIQIITIFWCIEMSAQESYLQYLHRTEKLEL